MGGRAEGEQVHDHRLVVADPGAEAGEAAGRLPAHAQADPAVAHELPVHPAVDLVRERADLHLGGVAAAEVLPRVQDAGQQQRGVDRGELGVPRHHAQRGAHVEEVVEEPLVADRAAGGAPLRLGPEGVERGRHAIRPVRARDPAMIDRDADRAQAEALAGDAAG